MNKFISFFKQTSPLLLILISAVMGIVAKLIEKYSVNTAMGMQTIAFVLFLYALIRWIDSKWK